MEDKNYIEVCGARVHNLRNVDVRIPRNSLTVITGLSGSGKSSLAFDTIFAEGQRRYIDTFGAYARGFIGNMARPDVDKISGLSPVISIDQKTTNHNPRSTVGTVTEVYDYLRLLYARAGVPYSYLSGEKMVRYSDEQILDLIVREYQGQRVYVLAPLVKNRKGHYKELFETIRKKGFLYVRVDGEICEVVQGMRLDRYVSHSIEVVVDRLKINGEDRTRLMESISKGMQQGDGLIMLVGCETPDGRKKETVKYFSRRLMCPTTGLAYADPAPHTFSFNSPQGWCPRCKGLGVITEITDDQINEVLYKYGCDVDTPFDRLPYLAVEELKELEANQEGVRTECPECHGLRLCKESLSYRIGDKNIAQLASMDIDELLEYLQNIEVELDSRQKAIAHEIIKEICSRLQFMIAVGLQYLNINRNSDSLSGGESQRIRLATQIGSRLVNVLYILDEPSIGLHQRDNHRLIESLKELRDLGNSVIVVEHDEQIMREADYIVDIGPKAGRLGGKIMFQGTPADLLKQDTLTARYLNHQLSMPTYQHGPIDDCKWLKLYGCRGNNLKGVDISIPLGRMVCVTGVSGSGKSTLINQTLYPILSQHFYRSLQDPLPYEAIEGIENIDKVIAVDQSPIGKTLRSNPATYTNVFTDIRNLFVQLPDSKIRGWKPGHFSFNTAGGRCEECSGNGYKTIQMHFLPDVYIPCEACGGKRYNRETLEVRFKGKNIGDVLDMTVNQAVEFFESQPAILKKIRTIQQVGLGYIKLGQSSTTLSGGESQRIKLAAELARPSTGRTLYILDEPTTGLHFEDVRVLLDVLNKLVEKGNTIVIIEHNLDVIRACDYIIDMGPEGGRGGGKVVASGTVDEIMKCKASLTGAFLSKQMKN